MHFCNTIGMTAHEKIYELTADNYGYIPTREDLLPVRSTFAEAIDWGNDLIDKISQA